MASHAESINLTFTTNTCSGTLATTVNVGDLIVVTAGGIDVPSTPTDNLGNTYTANVTSTIQDTVTCKTWYSVATFGGSCTVSVFFGTGGGSEAQAMLITGVASSPLDKSGSTNQLAIGTAANAINTPSRTPTLNNELIVGYTYNTDRAAITISVGTNFAFNLGAAGTNSKTEYYVQPSAGACTAGHNYTSIIMTFKPTPSSLTATSGSYVLTGLATVLRLASTMYLRYRK